MTVSHEAACSALAAIVTLLISAASTANAEILKLCDQSVDVTIEAPDERVPSALRSYLGVWAGTWEHGACAAVVVEGIRPDGSVRYIQVHGDRGGIYAERAGIYGRAGNYKDGQIVSTVQGGTVNRTFTDALALQGSALIIRRTMATERYSATLSRVAVSASPRVSSATPPPSPRRPAGGTLAFDGAWAVTMICPDVGPAKGYTLRYTIEIGNGVISGQYGVRDVVGSLTITGEVNPEGAASMRAIGRVANSANALGGAATGSPVNYGIAARFDGRRGTGTRTEQRPCSLTYEKQ